MEPVSDRNSPVPSRSICDRVRQWKCGGVPPTWLIICGAIITQIGWGFQPVFVKKYGAGEEANPFIFTFYRTAGCVPVLFTCSLVVERTIMLPQPKMIAVFMLSGLLGMFLAEVFYTISVYGAGPNIISIFQSLVPVWTSILAIVTCTERVPPLLMLHTWAKFLGIALGAGGAIEIMLTGTNFGSSTTEEHNTTNNSVNNNSKSTIDNFSIRTFLFGYVAALLQSTSFAMYLLIQKKLIFDRPNCKWRDYPIAVTAYSSFFGAVYVGLASIYFAATGREEEFIMPQATLVALVYAIFISSALCYGLVTWTSKNLPASVVAAFSPVQTLVTVIASYFVTGDELEPWQYAGAVILIGGLLLVLYSNHTDEKIAKGHRALQFNDCCHPVKNNNSEERSEEPLLHMNGGPTEQQDGEQQNGRPTEQQDGGPTEQQDGEQQDSGPTEQQEY